MSATSNTPIYDRLLKESNMSQDTLDGLEVFQWSKFVSKPIVLLPEKYQPYIPYDFMNHRQIISNGGFIANIKIG
jgi:hypothetical protein